MRTACSSGSERFVGEKTIVKAAVAGRRPARVVELAAKHGLNSPFERLLRALPLLNS